MKMYSIKVRLADGNIVGFTTTTLNSIIDELNQCNNVVNITIKEVGINEHCES